MIPSCLLGMAKAPANFQAMLRNVLDCLIQVACVRSEPRTSPKCEWQCLCSDPYVVQTINIEVDFMKRLHDDVWKQTFFWERALATKMAFSV